ncbi:hypothetical protein DMENIID0001_115310 [Sergentomyia squamirostris]
MKILCLLFSVFFAIVLGEEDVSQNIDFIVFKDKKPINTSELKSKNPVELGLCNAGEKLAVIVHGFTESCHYPWVLDLVPNLHEYRGGCIVCMDYSYYAKTINYYSLVEKFKDIQQVLYDQMVDYEKSGLVPSNTYMFGFSFGAHLVLQTASRLGNQVIKQIDVCDPAGPGFPDMPDAKNSAENVQCIHTSADLGTLTRNCHQNWNMGNCGQSQVAGLIDYRLSHGLCPVFYNIAFKNTFRAVPRPFACLLSPKETQYPDNFKMGYMETRKQEVSGILYAKTSLLYPYM